MTTASVGRRENLLTALFGLWLILGLFVDGWAHTNLAELETFFTPWHGLFYSGFTATALWVAWMIRARLTGGHSITDAIPPGYRLAALGLGIFAIGGMGDGIWHTLLGIERGVDALISPTHILLAIGIVLIVGAPMRNVAMTHPGRSLPKGDFLPVGLSMGLTTLIVSFFFMYTYAPASGQASVPFLPGISGEFEAEFGIMQILITTIIITGAALYLAARWDTPFWCFTSLFGLLGVLFAGMLDEFEQPWEMAAPIVAGLAADLFVRRFRPCPSRPGRWLALGGVIPLAMWSTHFATFAVFREIGWTPELWAGSIVLGVLVGVGLAHVMGRATVVHTTSELRSEAAAA